MASQSDPTEQHAEEELFGNSDGEMSDLDGDQGSDIDHTEKNDDNDQQQETEDADETVPPNSSASRLPSFKKRTREMTEEESAQLEELRRELREKRQRDNEDDEDEEDEEEKDAKVKSHEAPIDPEQAARDEFNRYFDKIMSSNKRRHRKADEEDLERAMDDELSSLRDRMKHAAETDRNSNEERKTAFVKLTMLDEVKRLLLNTSYQDSILDNQLLDGIRSWLEPLPDRSLPSLDIQNAMFDILDRLPIASDHLRESGVGKIVFFYTKAPHIDRQMQRRADQLVAKWTRLIIKRGASYQGQSTNINQGRKESQYEGLPSLRDNMPKSIIRSDKSGRPKAEGVYKRLKEKIRAPVPSSRRA